MIALSGYHVLQSHRPNGRRGGGICLVFSDLLKLIFVKIQSYPFFELLAAEVIFSCNSFTFSVTYRPKLQLYQISLQTHFSLSRSSFLFSPFIVVHDFNFPNCCDQGNSFGVLLNELDSVQHINFSTHILDNILDLIETSKSSFYLVDGLDKEFFDS